MAKLFIYYSLSGNGDEVANYLKERGFDIRKVETKMKLSKNLFLACMKGGFLAGLSHKAKLINYDNDISNYDEIYIGSPIWNARLSCPINTVLKKTDLSNKKLNFILYSGSGEGKKALKKINKKYPNSNVVFLRGPKKNTDELKKLGE